MDKQKQSQTGSASMAAVLGIGALMSLFMVNEYRKLRVQQSEVLGVNLTNLAREANESTLAKVRSLLIKDASGQSVLAVEGSKFKQVSGSGFSVVDGAVSISIPVSIGREWKEINQSQSLAAVANSPKLTTRVSIDDVTLGGVGGVEVAKVLVTAETNVKQGIVEKSVKSRALYDLFALAASPAPAAAPVPPAPPVPSPSAAVIPSPASALAPAVRPRLPTPSPAVAARPVVTVTSNKNKCSQSVYTNGGGNNQLGQNSSISCGHSNVNGKVTSNTPVSQTVNGVTRTGVGSISSGSGSSSGGSRGSTSSERRGGR